MFGVGFQIADTIARAGGRRAPTRRRARARGVVHVLAEAERDGSTCLPVAELAARGGARCSAAPPPDAALLRRRWPTPAQLVLELDDEAVWAYRPPTAALEAELAETVRRARRAPSRVLEAPGTRAPSDLVPAPEQCGGGARRVRARGSRSSPAAPAPARRRRSG